MKKKILSIALALTMILPNSFIAMAEDGILEMENLNIDYSETLSVEGIEPYITTDAKVFQDWTNTIQVTDNNGSALNVNYRGEVDNGNGAGIVTLGVDGKVPEGKTSYFYVLQYLEDRGVTTPYIAAKLELPAGAYKHGANVDVETYKYASQESLYFTIALSTSNYDKITINTKFDSEVNVKKKNTLSDWGSHWGKREIKAGMEKRWVNTSNVFRPNSPITRAEFIKIVNKAFSFTKKSYDIPFKDVSSTDWWYSEVQIALGNGYISTGNANFRPRDPITREEVANIITTITRTKDRNLDKLDKYIDKHLVAQSATSSVEGAIEQGYMGVGSNKFRPKDKITRAEAIVTLDRVVK